MYGGGGRMHVNNRGNSGSAMRGLFGVPTDVEQNANNRRRSQEALRARQDAVAEAFKKANEEKMERDHGFGGGAGGGRGGQNQPRQQQHQQPETRLPLPQQAQQQQRLFPQIPQHHQQAAKKDREQHREYHAPPSPPPSTSAHTSESETLMKIISSISNRITQSEKELSTVQQACESLHGHQQGMELKLGSLGASSTQIINLKKSLEELKSLANEAMAQASNSNNAVEKLSLQMFEHDTKMQQVQDSARTFDQNSVVIDELRLAVDELKAGAPLLANVDRDVTDFRREFHTRMQGESEFRDELKKKNQVLFGEIVRLGEAQDRDRGFARTEITEIAGLLQNMEKRVAGSSEVIDRIGKDHSSKLVNIDGILNVLETGLNNFGRDMQKVANSVSEEMKSRKAADEQINNIIDEFRTSTSNKFSSLASSTSQTSRQLTETLTSLVDSARLESSRGLKNVSEEFKSLKSELAKEEQQRSALANAMRTEMASHSEQIHIDISTLKEETLSTLSDFRSEEMGAIKKQAVAHEEMRGIVGDLERQVYENTSVSNSRIDRTRIALEEVIRAEIQSRQNAVSKMEGRVRDIVQDCVASIEGVGNEGRMASDALANRVNLLETGLTNIINGKISVMEEAVAARNYDQNEVNVKVEEKLSEIVLGEEKEHKERIQVEQDLKSRVSTVEGRVDGEIRQVRHEADEHAIKGREELKVVREGLEEECKAISNHVDEVEVGVNANKKNLELLTDKTNENFKMVHLDSQQTNDDVRELGIAIGHTNDKIEVNNVLSKSIEITAGVLERESKEVEDGDKKKQFEQFVLDREKTVLAKEEAREEELIVKFDKQMEAMKAEAAKTLETMRMNFESIIKRERENEMKRDLEMKQNLEEELKSSMIQNVVAVCLEGLVSAVEGQTSREELAEKERKAWVEKKELEAELEREKRKSDDILSKLLFLEETVKERERLENKEWGDILGGGTDFNGDDIIFGGGRLLGGESKGGPILAGGLGGIGEFPGDDKNEKSKEEPERSME